MKLEIIIDALFIKRETKERRWSGLTNYIMCINVESYEDIKGLFSDILFVLLDTKECLVDVTLFAIEYDVTFVTIQLGLRCNQI